ncbi:MAG: hypothetical protein FWD89_01490 [Firmicutes bacterium]|nr:hypothetical protein [Bacillota bacterium]
MLGAWGLLFWFVQASDRFELPVIWWMFLISQFFGLINAGIAVYRYQTKNKEKTLKMAAIGNIFKVFNYVFIFNWSLAGLKVISIFKNLFFAETSKGKMKLWQSLLILIIFSLISAAVVFWSWWYTRLWFEWVILGVTILSNFGKWAKGIHIHRVTSVIYRVAMIINSVYYYLNLTNLIKAVFVIATIIVFYVRLLKEKITSKKQKKIETEVQDGI